MIIGEKDDKYIFKIELPVIIITLLDNSFATYCDAIEELSKKFPNKKIFFMQSINEKGDFLKILIVFEL